jgi:tetratricopeptide (TPR) repeat protein
MKRGSWLLLLIFAAPLAHAGVVPAEAVADAEAGYFRRALARLEPLVATHAGDPELAFRHAEALIGVGRAAHPDDGAYRRLLATAYQRKMQALFEADPGLGTMLKMRGLLKATFAALEAAARLAPDDVAAREMLAGLYLEAPGFMGGDADKALEIADALEPLDRRAALKVRAQAAAHAGDVAASAAFYRRADALDTTSGSLVALGLMYAGAERYDEALAAFRAATVKDPNAPAPWYQIGRVAALSGTALDDGVAALTRYLAFAERPDALPSAGWAQLRLGNIHAHAGRRDAARAAFRAAAADARREPDLARKLETAEDDL